jgi:hypothetical protein
LIRPYLGSPQVILPPLHKKACLIAGFFFLHILKNIKRDENAALAVRTRS